MDQTELLLEYLKEQYAQARQHESLRTNATTFLTATASAILAFMFKDGELRPSVWWVGVLVSLVGLVNLAINEAHFTGNRFHTAMAGLTRRTLEGAIAQWTVKKPTEIRAEVLRKYGFSGPGISIGGKVQRVLRFVPIGVIALGVTLAVVARYSMPIPR